MFTEQMGKLASLFGVDIASPQGQMLSLLAQMSVMGNCAQDIGHRGPVSIIGDLPDAPEVCPGTVEVVDGRPFGDIPSLFTVAGHGTTDTNGCVRGGYTAAFFGPVYFSESPVGAMQWMSAATNWHDGTGASAPYYCVDMYRCDNVEADNIDTSRTYRVRFAWDTYGAGENPDAPNVEFTQALPVFQMPDGSYWTHAGKSAALGVTVDSNRDLSIGGGTAPGWGLANGSANSDANGGTGIDESGRFARMAASDPNIGDQGGSSSHTHDFTTDLATTGITATFATADALAAISASVSAAAIVATIQSITSTAIAQLLEDHTKQEVVDCIEDHAVDHSLIPDHTTNEVAACIADHTPTTDSMDNGATPVVTAIDAHSGTADTNDLDHGTGTQTLAHEPHSQNDDLEHTGVTDATYSLLAVGAATAAVSFAVVASSVAVAIAEGSGHQHGGTTDAASTLPPYTDKQRWERLNNSHEKIVAETSGGGSYPYSYTY